MGRLRPKEGKGPACRCVAGPEGTGTRHVRNGLRDPSNPHAPMLLMGKLRRREGKGPAEATLSP